MPCPGRPRHATGIGLLAAGAGVAGRGLRLATGRGAASARLLALHILVALDGATDLGGLLVAGALAILLQVDLGLGLVGQVDQAAQVVHLGRVNV